MYRFQFRCICGYMLVEVLIHCHKVYIYICVHACPKAAEEARQTAEEQVRLKAEEEVRQKTEVEQRRRAEEERERAAKCQEPTSQAVVDLQALATSAAQKLSAETGLQVRCEYKGQPEGPHIY